MNVPLGAISSVCDKIFDQIPSAKNTLCQVTISMMEAYNNEVREHLLYSVILENFLIQR